jgi:hypothetical protein
VNALLWYVHVTVSQFVVSHYALYNGGIPFQVTFFEISSKPNVNLSEFQDFAKRNTPERFRGYFLNLNQNQTCEKFYRRLGNCQSCAS